MPSSPGPARILLRPPADIDQRSIPITRQPPRTWFRVHRAGLPAVTFGKFPHHRFSHGDCPFPPLYVGASIQVCLWEIFGDDIFQNQRVIAESRWQAYCVSQITIPELRVCAVTLERTREALGVDRASLMAADLTVPQTWGLAIQRHPAGFEAIKYSSRFLDQACLVLFERGTLQSRLETTVLGGLNDLDSTVDWLHERKAALV